MATNPEPFTVEWISPTGRYKTKDFDALELAQKYAAGIGQTYQNSDVEILLPDGGVLGATGYGQT